MFTWPRRKGSFPGIFISLQSFISIFLPSVRQNVDESNYTLTCESKMQAAPKRDWIGSAQLAQKLLIKHLTEHRTQLLSLILWREAGTSNTNELPLWMSFRSRIFEPEHQLFSSTYLRPHLWSSSIHWSWYLTVNISYVCLLAPSVSVVQGQASLSWCTPFSQKGIKH